jgi:hypothetical protein
MSLPEFNEFGDLPEGVYQSTLVELTARFGIGSPQREAVTARLLRIRDLAASTGALDRLVVFGSYVTDKLEPNDVDIILVMMDDFVLNRCTVEQLALFDHVQADAEFGASIFWVRPSMLFLETLEDFIAHWQVKRDHTKRGIVEIKV